MSNKNFLNLFDGCLFAVIKEQKNLFCHETVTLSSTQKYINMIASLQFNSRHIHGFCHIHDFSGIPGRLSYSLHSREENMCLSIELIKESIRIRKNS